MVPAVAVQANRSLLLDAENALPFDNYSSEDEDYSDEHCEDEDEDDGSLEGSEFDLEEAIRGEEEEEDGNDNNHGYHIPTKE